MMDYASDDGAGARGAISLPKAVALLSGERQAEQAKRGTPNLHLDIASGTTAAAASTIRVESGFVGGTLWPRLLVSRQAKA